ncbi:hypothetical protein [Actinomadura sp. KC216]|uniref:hypothetical protein n=1 Tax=Actinomadura sp. KC216 TaxID=2530370 RepID=UPI001404EFAF|nr:hypothetical protein [Actinomadura sp. KC216]
MTTDPDDEHGEILRRALHAEAETVNPAGDGLVRIRARIADGPGRRFGLGRFGLARYGLGFDRFTINWARPVLAVAAAVVIAGLGVTAPQTIDLIQQSVGNSGPADGDRNPHGGDRTDAGGDPQFPDPSSPGAGTSGDPSSAASPSTDPSQGISACRIPRPPAGTPTAAASPGPEQTPAPSTTPCPGTSASQSPPTSPTPTTSTPDPGDPTDEPTPTVTTESAQAPGSGTP